MTINRRTENQADIRILDGAELDRATGGSIVDVVSDVWDAVTSPRDPASGLPTGKRMHGPLRIT